jgi:adenylylsulfate kinase
MKVTKSRSFVKSMTYRIFGTITSWAVVYAITHKGSLASLIAIWETIVKVGVYYWHERVWNNIRWGRK